MAKKTKQKKTNRKSRRRRKEARRRRHQYDTGAAQAHALGWEAMRLIDLGPGDGQ